MGEQVAPLQDLEQPCSPPSRDEAEANDGKLGDLASIDFVTLGMFIIDNIEFPHPRPPARNVLGGAGSFSALGARIMSPPPLSTSIGWIVDMGVDFPPTLTTLIDSWETSAMMRQNLDRLTTRGWNGYHGAEKRAFKYVTPKKRLTAQDLTPGLLLSKSFHIICSPTRCRDLVSEITSLRKKLVPEEAYTRPLVIWEPVPDRCTPDELLNLTATLSCVDICSPNHAELAAFMGDDGLDPDTGEISTAAVERNCEQLLASICLHSFTLVIRAGDKGCFLARNGGRRRQLRPAGSGKKRRKGGQIHGSLQPDTDMEALFAGLLQDEDGSVAREEIEGDVGLDKWIPAYHQTPGKAVDPTGAGNCFLGGFAVAIARGKAIEEAAAWGSVAASFAIEQVGVPALGKDEYGNETWNGVRVEDRMKEFRARFA